MGIPALCSYGMTEACSQIATELLSEADGESCGVPLPGVEVRIGGEEADEGEVGEIEIRGQTVVAEAWLKTGDFGYWDAKGRLVVLSRRTDLIVSGGENIYPAEIERVLLKYPGVSEAAIGACPSKHWGEVPIALVVISEGLFVEEALLQHCRKQLASYKIPKAIFAVDELPKNAAGKIERQELRERVRQYSAPFHF
jgi:O-succinylbenzoic acid--CoA ligase